MKLVECIPNFSEARRSEVIDDILAAISGVEGVRLLDRSSDLDHNRTVITYAGSPEAVEEAAYRAIKTAASLIDLDRHTGEHPRIGATDVVPFVPLAGATMEECVEMARRLGERVGRELQIPVYLYEMAATRPDRANLENLRRGQYEGLKAEIQSDPERKPDFGPTRLGPAGATVIGARNPLIAFNVYLTTPEVEVAKKIARAIRHSSGGMRHVKALGLLVEGRAQVSINLTNFRESPVGRVVELIRREASRYGVGIHHTEIVGLVPQEALVDAAVWYTQLGHFRSNQVLETRLYEAGAAPAQELPAGDSTLSFIEQVAAATAAPGGGAAAAYAGALAAGLVEMVSGLTLGKKKYAAVEAEMQAIRIQAAKLRAELSHGVDDDSAAFEAVLGAYKLPKETEPEQQARQAAVQVAMLTAAHVPLHAAANAVKVMELSEKCARDGNLNAISDAMTAAQLAHAAVISAGYNVRINLKSVDDRAAADRMLQELGTLEQAAARVTAEMTSVIRERGGLS